MPDHQLIGRLRGKAAPRHDVLRRLQGMNPRFRVHWLPEAADGLPYWAIMEHRPDPAWQAVGRYRLDRYAALAAHLNDRSVLTARIQYECEQIMDGDHLVALYPDEGFGTEWMFADLAQGEQAAKAQYEQVLAAQRLSQKRDIESEMEANAEFCAAVEAKARDDYGIIVKKRVSSVVPATIH